MLDTRKVAKKLRELRESNNMTQTQVAEALFVSRQAVSSWEIGNTMPSIESCIMLLDIYNCSLEELLCLQKKEGSL
ncbi:MAG: helix-turn-helix transcriptional regulator [Erysipelotrichaceae bacterium]|nr:helix-turn-helix transcriptional regulator [Erysipelotrichaceae bacterium]MBR2545614.1 helix-turn-helix transcriptional regulator [Erysipelotrichaceae bacterium]MBR2702369.1 helix-turn-helix transcriptional regulator [Erysipelotrichaceae bacterium]MBR6836626.1 helix-turn-helix transcriptional regulator [Oscillospiraceae bacterium]